MRARGLVYGTVCLIITMASNLAHGETIQNNEPDKIARLVKQLENNRFASREAASRELEEIGEPALSALRQTAAASTDLEARRRARKIIRVISDRLLAVAARKELARWEGEWEESRGTTLFIKGDRWSWGTKGGKPAFNNIIRVVEIREGMVLADLVVGDENHARRGQSVKAIFRLEGDTLHYCGSFDLPRPTRFVKGLSDPYYVEWKRVK